MTGSSGRSSNPGVAASLRQRLLDAPPPRGMTGKKTREFGPIVYGAGAPEAFPPSGGASLRPLRGGDARDAGGKPTPRPCVRYVRSTQENELPQVRVAVPASRARRFEGSDVPAPDGLTLLSIAERKRPAHPGEMSPSPKPEGPTPTGSPRLVNRPGMAPGPARLPFPRGARLARREQTAEAAGLRVCVLHPRHRPPHPPRVQ